MNSRSAIVFVGLVIVVAFSVYIRISRTSAPAQIAVVGLGESGGLVNATRKINQQGAVQRDSVSQQTTAMVSRLYAAKSHNELLQLARGLSLEFALDAFDLIDASSHICRVGAIGSDTPGESWLGKYRALIARGRMAEHQDTESSFRYLDRFMADHCGSTKDFPAARYAAEWLTERDAQGRKNSDYARLQTATQELSAGASAEAVFVATDVASSTRSPAVFLEAVGLLASVEGWFPEGYQPPALAPMDEIRELGNQLAYCSLMGRGCGPGSLLAARYCAPSNCIPGESVAQFLARNHSPSAMREAEKYYRALLRMRRGG